MSIWTRQIHRWTSIIFTAISAAIFVSLGLGRPPAQWVYYLPLAPLAVLVMTGIYMFWRHFAGQKTATLN